jgi:hypothetical protein
MACVALALLLVDAAYAAVTKFSSSSMMRDGELNAWMSTHTRSLFSSTTNTLYECPSKAKIDPEQVNALFAASGLDAPVEPGPSCHGRAKSSSGDGCVWEVRDFLSMLFDQGVNLLRIGGDPEFSFGSLRHGFGLAWNLCVCDPEHNKKDGSIEISSDWEHLYGSIMGRKIAQMKMKHGSIAIAKMSPLQIERMLYLRSKVTTWDIEMPLDNSLLPNANLFAPLIVDLTRS